MRVCPKCGKVYDSNRTVCLVCNVDLQNYNKKQSNNDTVSSSATSIVPRWMMIFAILNPLLGYCMIAGLISRKDDEQAKFLALFQILVHILLYLVLYLIGKSINASIAEMFHRFIYDIS